MIPRMFDHIMREGQGAMPIEGTATIPDRHPASPDSAYG